MAALANARRDFGAALTWAEAALKADPKRWTAYPQLIDAHTGLGHRRDTLRASKAMQDRAFADPKIKFVWDSEVA
ncbi:hypothetical protein ACWEGM_33330, partial [Streptomyces nigra]